jgi:hypothetical protein
MVLKYKIWRLAEEWRAWRLGRKHKGKKVKRRYLVLRDKQGINRKLIRADVDKKRLKAWYRKYHVQERLSQYLNLGRLKEHIRKMKAQARRQGFKFQISIYGITKNLNTGKRAYARYEIFKATPWTHDTVKAVHDFFRVHPPLSKSGVYVYHGNPPNDKLYRFHNDTVTRYGTGQVGYGGEKEIVIVG